MIHKTIVKSKKVGECEVAIIDLPNLVQWHALVIMHEGKKFIHRVLQIKLNEKKTKE